MAAADTDLSHTAASFGELLRQHRLAQGLTQETLAERAGLSAHGIQKLERGVTHPYRETAERLGSALQLAGGAAITFQAAAHPAPQRRAGGLSVNAHADSRVRHNLPFQTTSFVGRQDDLTRVRERLGESRLLTITGSGGCGKMRLALEVGRDVLEEYHDGVWLVDLAPLSDPSLVRHLIATVLGIREEPGRPVAEAVADYLRDRSSLIILDNCEHLIDTSATIADVLLRAAAKVRLQWTAIPGGEPLHARYGLGILSLAGFPGHNGGIPGYSSIAMYLPEADATIVVLVNQSTLEGGPADFLFYQLGGLLFSERFASLQTRP